MVDKSEAVKTYSTGPNAEPWIILVLIGSIKDIGLLPLPLTLKASSLWARKKPPIVHSVTNVKHIIKKIFATVGAVS